MTYRLPSLNSLRAFEAAARHLSFKTAAVELGVSAGAISQQVKKLEASLGAKLFRRLPHGLLLTEEGETYLPKVTGIFEDLTVATEEISPKINSKKFKVGICPAAQKRLPPNWPGNSAFLSSHIREIISTSDVDLIRSDELDCLIKLDGGPYGELSLTILTLPHTTKKDFQEIHFICKPGFSKCRQAKAILSDLSEKISTTW